MIILAMPRENAMPPSIIILTFLIEVIRSGHRVNGLRSAVAFFRKSTQPLYFLPQNVIDQTRFPRQWKTLHTAYLMQGGGASGMLAVAGPTL